MAGSLCNDTLALGFWASQVRQSLLRIFKGDETTERVKDLALPGVELGAGEETARSSRGSLLQRGGVFRKQEVDERRGIFKS